MLIRVQKILAQAGIASRRKCEELIKQGRVKVNDQTIKPGDKADPEKDKICLDSKPLKLKISRIYLILNKPWGITTTVSEPHHGRKTARNLIPLKEKVFPAGRLDRYSDGLLLFTNDGDLAQKLTHPSSGVSKLYLVKLDHPITPPELAKIWEIEIGKRKIAVEEILQEAPNRVKIKIHEGRKHIIRKVFERLGYHVTKLTRLQFGPLKLGNLKVSQWRFLALEEIKKLKEAGKKV